MPSSLSYQQVPDTFKSDSALVPDAPLRPTQSNIGYYLTKKTDLRDDRYGLSKIEYGGIGDATISGGETVARNHLHLRTGLQSDPPPPVRGEALVNLVHSNRGLFASEINRIGPVLFELSRSLKSEPLPKLAEKQLFPRSIRYELAYTKAVNKKAMLEALERERMKFEEKLKRRVQKEDSSQESSAPELKKLKEEAEPVTKRKETEPVAVMGGECRSVCGPCGCTLVRGVCPNCLRTGDMAAKEIESELVEGWKEGQECRQWPSEGPRSGSSWAGQRTAQLLRVGYPFAQEASSWLYCTTKPLDCSSLYRPSKRRFPERSFSSLNI